MHLTSSHYVALAAVGVLLLLYGLSEIISSLWYRLKARRNGVRISWRSYYRLRWWEIRPKEMVGYVLKTRELGTPKSVEELLAFADCGSLKDVVEAMTEAKRLNFPLSWEVAYDLRMIRPYLFVGVRRTIGVLALAYQHGHLPDPPTLIDCLELLKEVGNSKPARHPSEASQAPWEPTP